MDAMGIKNSDQVIVYGREGSLFTPRIWYMFRRYGQERVGIMEGSLEEWVDKGGQIDTDAISDDLLFWAKDLVAAKVTTANYKVPADAKEPFVDMEQVLQMVNKQQHANDDDNEPETIIVDTRGSSFAKGHIPGAVHIPYSSLVEKDNSLKLKPRAELMSILKSKGLGKSDDGTKSPRVLLSCGSGVSVCHMALVLEECGYDSPIVYDGSWNEYGKDPDTPKTFPENKIND
jgi:thiosulfate/3-mercaptopyruvate sulfurtransferase